MDSQNFFGRKIKWISLKNLIIALLIPILLSGCGIPVPEDKRHYVGEWQGQGMYLLILQDGSVNYKRLKGGATVTITGPIKEFQGNNFIIGFALLKTTFVVSKPPSEVDGMWKMVVDGVALTKTDG